MTNDITEAVVDPALEAFMEYFRRNYPGPDTIIGRPDWHSPKIFRAAVYAMKQSGALVPAADVQGLQDYDADLIKRLRDCANGIGNFKTERGDYGLCDDAADAIARVTEEKDEAISHAIYNAQYVDLVSQYKARAETADAAVAAALMQAVETIRKKIYPLGKSEDWSPMGAHLAEGLDLAIAAILALITPDAMAALEAVKAEARREVLDELNDVLPTGWVGQPHCSNMDYGPNVAVAARAIISAMRAAMEAKP